MYDIFGKYGAIRQIRVYGSSFDTDTRNFSLLTSGTSADTRGTAFVVYEDIYDAKNACEKLSGFNVAGR